MHRYDAQCGRVFDADTAEPIEGAAVVGLYHTVTGTPDGDVSRWAATQETVTDADGMFCLPATTLLEPRLPPSWFDDYVEVWVFKPSYTLFDGDPARARLLQTRATPKGTVTKYPLKKLATLEERRLNLKIQIIGESVEAQWDKHMPHYYKLYNDEREDVGLQRLRGGAK